MEASTPFLFSSRLLITCMCFLAVCNMMFFRLNMSVGIVCMVNSTHVEMELRHNGDTDLDPNQDDAVSNQINQTFPTTTGKGLQSVTDSLNQEGTTDNGKAKPTTTSGPMDKVSKCGTVSSWEGNKTVDSTEDGPIIWSKHAQGQILASYYYGYVVSQVPSGWMARRIGGKNLILVSSLAATVTCLFIPITALNSLAGTITLRIITGLLGGMTSPAVQNILSNWSPPSERATMGTFTFAGFPCGSLIAFILPGFLCQYGFAGGWPSVFYTSSISGLVFSIAWFLLVTETPSRHKRISTSEKNFITRSLKDEVKVEYHSLKTPWKGLLTSLPVYAIIVIATANDFSSVMFSLYTPTYLSEVMNFDISENGLVSSLPFIFCFMCLYVSGYVSDLLIRKTRLTTGHVRKCCNAVGSVVCIASLISIGYMDCEQPYLATTLLVLSVGGVGILTNPVYVNPLDVAPQYSGLITGIACTISSSFGFLSSVFVSAIRSQGSSRESWQIVFLVSASVFACSLIFYTVFGSGDVQSWALPPKDKETSRPATQENGEKDLALQLLEKNSEKTI